MLIARTGGDVNISNFTFEGATGPGATGVVEIFETVPGASRVAISDGRIADGFGTGVHIVNSRAVVENVSVVNMADKPGSLPDDFIRLGQGFYVQQTGAGGVSTVRLEGNRVSNSASTTATGFLLEAPNGTLNATLGGNSVSGVGDLALSLFVTNGANGVVYLDSGSRFAGGVNGFNAGLGARLEKIGVAPTSFNIVQQDAETFTERNGGTVEYVPDEDAFQFNVPSPLPQP